MEASSRERTPTKHHPAKPILRTGVPRSLLPGRSNCTILALESARVGDPVTNFDWNQARGIVGRWDTVYVTGAIRKRSDAQSVRNRRRTWGIGRGTSGRPTYVVNRIGDGGLPIDISFLFPIFCLRHAVTRRLFQIDSLAT